MVNTATFECGHGAGGGCPIYKKGDDSAVAETNHVFGVDGMKQLIAALIALSLPGAHLEDVQRLAGHANPRTTRLYDRRDRKITRNIVERISI